VQQRGQENQTTKWQSKSLYQAIMSEKDRVLEGKRKLMEISASSFANLATKMLK